ncbi:DNA repair protein rad14 [Grifola frondosa]|uniref:DNA repair protein rad14 n=1 Tax=Grifola frondosa TaxID=5627 RepID=A0A1C7MPY1_GRIFR|nr:DNA repair protein rad14 [Grifola frondosa]
MFTKAKQREREQEASSSSTPNANNKRPLGVVPATSTSPTAPKPPPKLKRDSRLGKYFEYDLSKMVNSKGGFLVEDGKEVDAELRAKERERERQRAMQTLEPPIFLDPTLNPKCNECQSLDIDQTYKKVFGCLDYLLTDPELRDQELMPHLLKANPHKSTFANMMLFLRYQVEDFAWKKWGSPEALDAEYERRTAEKKKKKNKKFEEGLKELRRRTRETVWQKRKDQEHKHVFGVVEKGSDGVGKQVAQVLWLSPSSFSVLGIPDQSQPADRFWRAGTTSPDDGQRVYVHRVSRRVYLLRILQEENEEISMSLEVEQLDVNLFRSKKLFIPYASRGVYGGQVISQALVSATNCVDPAFGLHCYFLLGASASIPILYNVDRVRDGRSYVTRAVRAVQRGRTVFIMLCSFQRPEPLQPSFQWPMPLHVPDPETCEDIEAYYDNMSRREGVDPRIKVFCREYAEERKQSPIYIKVAGVREVPDGLDAYLYWYKAKNAQKYEASFQKIISERGGSGRGSVHGRMYTRTGTLIAVTSQEGAVRANIKAVEQKAKM